MAQRTISVQSNTFDLLGFLSAYLALRGTPPAACAKSALLASLVHQAVIADACASEEFRRALLARWPDLAGDVDRAMAPPR